MGKGSSRESSHTAEALKQVTECHQHSPGDLAKLFSCTLQRNHPPSLPTPESEDFPWLPIRLFAYHHELLSIIVFHDEPFYLHATSSLFPVLLVRGTIVIVMAKETLLSIEMPCVDSIRQNSVHPLSVMRFLSHLSDDTRRRHYKITAGLASPGLDFTRR
jgi:hypothetical protein